VVADSWMADFRRCELCIWRCGVDRLAGELGVCGQSWPQIASATLHPAPPASFTLFIAGCNFNCLHCQNWAIAFSPPVYSPPPDPQDVARTAVGWLRTPEALLMGADRLFFSGGCPTTALPYIEAIVAEARRLLPSVGVNFDTNGYMTPESLERVARFATSITFDLRAIDEEVHQALCGAPAKPVLKNAAAVARRYRKLLYEFRILVVPGINEDEIVPLCRFLAGLDVDLPVCFLAFRPNFALEDHPGSDRALMERAVATARNAGLTNVAWSGSPGIAGCLSPRRHKAYSREGARIAGAVAEAAGCPTHPRLCGRCPKKLACPLRLYQPARSM
jgi:pyruvate formate lyase activating enzyme